MAAVTLEKVNKQYENGFHAVQNLDLEIADGKFLVLVGPSGAASRRRCGWWPVWRTSAAA